MLFSKKKRVTAVEVDKLGKEPGNRIIIFIIIIIIIGGGDGVVVDLHIAMSHHF